MNKPSKVIFMNDELEEAFNSLSDKDPIKKALINAIRNIKEDYQAGEYIPKSKIPADYLNKYKIDNIKKSLCFTTCQKSKIFGHYPKSLILEALKRVVSAKIC